MTEKPPLRHRQTKIVATLGPASADIDMIRRLFVAGVDVFRLNFSHGSHEDHRARVESIRSIEKEFETPIGIIADLQGPKLRVGRFKGGSIALSQGMKLRLDLDEAEGDEHRVNLPHPEIIKALEPGAFILVDDGKVRMKILEKGKDHLLAEVVSGTRLSNNKGVNVPGVVLPIPALTEKDRKDLTAALSMNVDWIAQSFVQRPEDVAETRKLIAGRAGLLAKIEKPSALQHFDAILDLVDAIMLARGDLGVEIPPEDVPAVQKNIVRRVRDSGKPIIVATQMLESMIESPSPTRAEASDVATAVYDGTDAVMLSAETAAGKYPARRSGCDHGPHCHAHRKRPGLPPADGQRTCRRRRRRVGRHHGRRLHRRAQHQGRLHHQLHLVRLDDAAHRAPAAADADIVPVAQPADRTAHDAGLRRPRAARRKHHDLRQDGGKGGRTCRPARAASPKKASAL